MADIFKNKSNVVEEILEKYGKYHYIQTTLIFITMCVLVWSNLNFVFIAGDVNYRCKIQECESYDQPFKPDWWPDGEINKCFKPILNLTTYSSSNTCTNQSFTQDMDKCTEWVYENNDTIVSELNLACRVWEQNMIGMVHGIGTIFSVLICGWVADRFGRKLTLIICLVGYVVGYFKLLVTSYSMYLVIEFIEGAFSGGVLGCGTLLLIENVPKKTRMWVGVLLEIAFDLGVSLFACLGMVANNWRTLVTITYSPCILFLSYIFLIKESPRWQILQGKVKEAKATLRMMARMNNIDINIDEFENMDDNKIKKLFNLEDVQEEELKEVFLSLEMIKRLAMGIVTSFTGAFIYFGLQINSVYLPGNKYTNFLYGAIVSCPGGFLALYLMNKYGRKYPLIYGFIVCAVSSIAMECIPDNYNWLKIVMFFIAKVAISGAFSGIVIYTMEVYPTSVRGSMVGLCILASNLGNMVAPLVPSLVLVSPVLLPICYGGSSLLSTFCLFFTPETNNLPLPATMKEIEKNYNIDTDKTKSHATNVGPQDNLGFDHDFETHL